MLPLMFITVLISSALASQVFSVQGFPCHPILRKRLSFFFFQVEPGTPSGQLEQLQQTVVEMKKDFETRLWVLENDFKKSQDELLRTKEELSRTKSQLLTLSSNISEVKDPSSFMFVFGFRSSSWTTLGTTIPFDSISSEYNNPGNMLDISTSSHQFFLFICKAASELNFKYMLHWKQNKVLPQLARK